MGNYLTNSAVPFPFRQPERTFVRIKKHAIVGANSVILPGVTVGEGAAIGANSLVLKDCEPWTIYVGSPARPLKPRRRDKIIELESQLRRELYNGQGNTFQNTSAFKVNPAGNMKNNLTDLAINGGSPAFMEKLHVGRPNIGDRQRLHARLDEMLDRRWLTNEGPFAQEFEARLAALAGTRHAIAFCNATVALELMVRGANLAGEVIVPSFTFVATVHCLHAAGLTPVFCDVDPATHCLDPEKAESLITPRTSAIMAVHIVGAARVQLKNWRRSPAVIASRSCSTRLMPPVVRCKESQSAVLGWRRFLVFTAPSSSTPSRAAR